MTDKELFLKICKKYGLKENKKKTGLMMKSDGKTRPLSKEDIFRMFSFVGLSQKEVHGFDYGQYYHQINGRQEYEGSDEFSIAC